MGYKRVNNGGHLYEWSEDEKIVRRYSVVDCTLPLAEWTVKEMTQRWKPLPADLARWESQWEQQGRVVRPA